MSNPIYTGSGRMIGRSDVEFYLLKLLFSDFLFPENGHSGILC
jgi:hypothetical protein